MPESVVYFAGPLTLWGKKPAEDEFIARFQSRWRALALARAQALYKRMDPARVGWFMTDGDTVLVHVRPTGTTGDPA